jgi:CheY-like chemotaxis protein
LSNNPLVDLVMSDISMPDMSGEDVCKQIRANPAFAGLVVVAYTAHANPVDVQRYLANGFDAALIKPIFMQGLRDALAKFFPTPV